MDGEGTAVYRCYNTSDNRNKLVLRMSHNIINVVIMVKSMLFNKKNKNKKKPALANCCSVRGMKFMGFILVCLFYWVIGVPRVLIDHLTELERFSVCITPFVCVLHIKF